MAGRNGRGGGDPVQVIVKADEILGLLLAEGEKSVAEIAAGLGEPRSTVHRLVRTLEGAGFVDAAPDGGYRLGLRMFELARARAAGMPIIAAARPALARLSGETGETALLMVREGARARCLDRIGGARVQLAAVGVGGTLPLHLGAAPLTLLAFAGEDDAHAYLRAPDLERRTARSATDPATIAATLRRIRERGYAISDGDLVPGIAEVAAPVHDPSGRPVAAISLSGPAATLRTADSEATARLVREAASRIEA